MPNLNTDQLFVLIKSLSKAEKRYFKLFVGKKSSSEDLIFLKLFDLMDKQKVYDEKKILEKESSIKASQISNLKAHLYSQIMLAIRNYNPCSDIDLQIHQYLDFAKLLYNRCLYEQCLKQIEKAKSLAQKNNRIGLLYTVHDFEKKLVRKFIRTNIENQVNEIIDTSKETFKKLKRMNDFTNLTLKLYTKYLKTGYTRNSLDFEEVNKLIYSSLPAFEEDQLNNNEKILLYNIFSGYYLFIQDFDRAYEYVKKWLQVFDEDPQLKIAETEIYIRALSNLIVTLSKLYKYDEYKIALDKLRAIKENPEINLTYNLQLLLFRNEATHKLNKYFILGQFDEGVKVIDSISEDLQKYEDKLDQHSILIFYYKFACMYFGEEDYKQSVYWLNKIISSKDVELRSDIHCFARIMSLICHYELENTDNIDYYLRSTYRYLIKKNDLHLFQKFSLKFLRKLTRISQTDLPEAFSELREQLLPLQENTYEKRAFTYFDMISWLESKLNHKSIQEIIKEKSEKKRQVFV